MTCSNCSIHALESQKTLYSTSFCFPLFLVLFSYIFVLRGISSQLLQKESRAHGFSFQQDSKISLGSQPKERGIQHSQRIRLCGFQSVPILFKNDHIKSFSLNAPFHAQYSQISWSGRLSSHVNTRRQWSHMSNNSKLHIQTCVPEGAHPHLMPVPLRFLS